MLLQVKAGIEAAQSALAMEDNNAHDNPALNDGVADELRREGIRARLALWQSELNSITGLLAEISNQAAAIMMAVDSVERWYMFAYPNPETAVQGECDRAYHGFTDGDEVKGIEGYLEDIAEILEEEF